MMIAPDRTSDAKLTVLNPMGYPPAVTRKSAAPRLESLDGKTVYLVDCRFDDSIELLKQVQAWFAEHMPGVTTKMVSLSAYYGARRSRDVGQDQGRRRRGDPRRRALQHVRASRRHPRDHARHEVRHSHRRAAH